MAIEQVIAKLRKRIKEQQDEADLQHLKGRIDGLKFARQNLCNCEICFRTKAWYDNQIRQLSERYEILKDERTKQFEDVSAS